MGYHYRCGKYGCRKRYSLPKKKEEYRTTKQCSCGGNLNFDPEVKRRRKKETCKCDGAHYPHRQGSILLCKEYSGELTDEDLRDMYRQVPRSYWQ